MCVWPVVDGTEDNIRVEDALFTQRRCKIKRRHREHRVYGRCPEKKSTKRASALKTIEIAAWDIVCTPAGG